MKKITVTALVLALAALALAGCTPQAPAAPPAPPAPVFTYNNGTFFASSDATSRGYMTAEVTIADDKITAVVLRGYGNLGTEKPESYPHAPYNELLVELPKAMIAANKAEVDAFTGATSSSKQSVQAVQRAMEKALKAPASTAKYFDGTFMAVSDQDARGAWTVVLVTLENDKITEVVINQTRKDADGRDVFKDADYAWDAYHEAIKELPKAMIAANKANVDAFSGATATSTQAIQAVERALELATR